jgi:hypothetical protein
MYKFKDIRIIKNKTPLLAYSLAEVKYDSNMKIINMQTIKQFSTLEDLQYFIMLAYEAGGHPIIESD